MTTMLDCHTATLTRPDLRVKRTDIEFWNRSRDVVVIEFVVRNHGHVRSPETVAEIQAAPLGAFVPWKPLRKVTIPSLDPGEDTVVRTEVMVDTPPLDLKPVRAVLGGLLTARGALDRLAAAWTPTSSGKLPADLPGMLRGDSTHWVGNLNIFVGGEPVEIHRDPALRIYPGTVNEAMFVVGSGADSYAFNLTGAGAEWDCELYTVSRSVALQRLFNSVTGQTSLPLLGGGERSCVAIEPGQWVPVSNQSTMILAIRPPADCRKGVVAIEVEQQSTGKQTVVEFSLDADAAGPGCYKIS